MGFWRGGPFRAACARHELPWRPRFVLDFRALWRLLLGGASAETRVLTSDLQIFIPKPDPRRKTTMPTRHTAGFRRELLLAFRVILLLPILLSSICCVKSPLLEIEQFASDGKRVDGARAHLARIELATFSVLG